MCCQGACRWRDINKAAAQPAPGVRATAIAIPLCHTARVVRAGDSADVQSKQRSWTEDGESKPQNALEGSERVTCSRGRGPLDRAELHISAAAPHACHASLLTPHASDPDCVRSLRGQGLSDSLHVQGWLQNRCVYRTESWAGQRSLNPPYPSFSFTPPSVHHCLCLSPK